MSDLIDSLIMVSSRISEILEESATELSVTNSQKLEEMLEDLIDIVTDLDQIAELDENPPKIDINEIIYDLDEEDNLWD
jgi:hypothetical protein